MSNNAFKNQLSGLIDPQIGETSPLEKDDQQLISAYNEGYNKLSDEEKLLAFKNIIRNSGRCGFASGGSIQYLINTDSKNRYRVTIRTYWRSGIHSGQSDRPFIIEAGSRIFLGCTDSGYIPITYYRREVVGEVKLRD